MLEVLPLPPAALALAALTDLGSGASLFFTTAAYDESSSSSSSLATVPAVQSVRRFALYPSRMDQGGLQHLGESTGRGQTGRTCGT